jgi:hypothetical protein
MERQTFQGYNCDLGQLQKSITTYFVGRGHKVTNFYKEKMFVTQAYKNQLVNKTILCKISGVSENFDISIGIGARIVNVNALQLLEKYLLTLKSCWGEPLLERNFMNFVFTQTELKRNTSGLLETNTLPSIPIWKEREIVREIEVVYCRHCGTKNNARQTNCSTCNASLH